MWPSLSALPIPKSGGPGSAASCIGSRVAVAAQGSTETSRWVRFARTKECISLASRRVPLRALECSSRLRPALLLAVLALTACSPSSRVGGSDADRGPARATATNAVESATYPSARPPSATLSPELATDPETQSPSPSPPRSPSPSAIRSPDPQPGRFAALWPETAQSEVHAAAPAWRESARATTAHFAIAVLRWKNPIVRSTRSRFHLEKGDRAFIVLPAAGADGIEVHAARVVDSHRWSVTYLWGFGASEPPASVGISATRAYVGFGYWGRARSAQLLLRYGPHQIARTATRKAEWTTPITFKLNMTGAVIVLFLDKRGAVFTGWGTALPVGPFSAG